MNILQYIDLETLKLGIGLIIFMAVNIMLGSLGSLFTQTFNHKILLQGVIKALIVVVCFVMIYIAGVLNAEIAVININGEEVTVLTAIYFLILGGFIHYVKEVILKLKDLIQSKINIGEGM